MSSNKLQEKVKNVTILKVAKKEKEYYENNKEKLQ